MHACSAAKRFLTLCNPIDYGPLGFSMGFSRQQYWSGLLFPPLGDLPDSRIESMSPVSPALASGFFTTESPRKPQHWVCVNGLNI